jgi:MYXO-CTERM domain-containing protein
MTFAINRTPSLAVETANAQVVTGQTVRVSVTDEYDEQVVDASVRVGGETVTATDENGEALVTIESAGSVDVVATKGDLEAAATVEGVSPSTETTAVTTTLTTTEAPTTTEDESDGLPTPGFGGVAALVAVALSLLALARRRES